MPYVKCKNVKYQISKCENVKIQNNRCQNVKCINSDQTPDECRLFKNSDTYHNLQQYTSNTHIITK